MGEFGIGQGVPRTEDPRLLTGGGRYVEDVNLPRQAHGYILRSPHAHARFTIADTAAALAAPGVIAIFTGDDLKRDGIGDIPCEVPRKRRDGRPMFIPPHPALVTGAVKLVGDYVALVVAETLAQAKDAAELIDIDYQPLASVTDTAAAVAPGAPAVWDEVPDNECFLWELGDKAGVDAAFARADHVATVEFVVTRVTAAAMEPRGAVADFDRPSGRYTLYTGSQNPHQTRELLARRILHIPEADLRVVAGDVGGSFGMKGGMYPESILVLYAAGKLGRPVKWVADRSESFMSDDQGRDNISTVSLALDRNGKFLGLKVETVAALGAYLSIRGPHSPTNNLGGLSGTYVLPAIHAAVRGVFTNTNSTSPYRGAGRPEATYAIERAIDAAARAMGIDRAELRRRNMIPPDAMPYNTGFVFTYDCGRFADVLDDALKAADYAGFETRRAEAASRGRLRGIGVVSCIEVAAAGMEETADIRFDPSGMARLLMGSVSHGQGHETTFKQVVADHLGLAPEQVRVMEGDTDYAAFGRGTMGSRTAALAGSALVRAAEKIVDKGRRIAAHVLETAEADIEFADGRFTVAGTDRAMTLGEIAAAAHNAFRLPADMEIGLAATASFFPKLPTFPNGAHVCELEIEPETGRIAILRYIVVDDVGTVINPLLVKGQIQGGVAQGVGQALCETIRWEDDSGQLLTGSFMDYCMPRADDLSMIEVASHPVPTAVNPLGVKGAGEAGTVGALACTINAVIDALAPLGITHIDMPASPERVWRAIRAAQAAQPGKAA